jgi:hypothetical protein
MQRFQTSFFYDLQELMRQSPLLRKYYYIFKALDLSVLPDRNHGVGATGHSRHAILRALIIKHLEGIKTVPQLLDYLNSIPPLMEMCGFELGHLREALFGSWKEDSNCHGKKNSQAIGFFSRTDDA